MQLKPALTAAIADLTTAQVPSPRMNAELLLMFSLSCDRAHLYAYPERELTEEETIRYESALAERKRGVPAQYITGHQEFWGLDLIVSPAVLIPRPETEHIIEAVLELTTDSSPTGAKRRKNAAHGASRGLSEQNEKAPEGRKKLTHPENETNAHPAKSGSQDSEAKLRIADIGTGSGAIALALAKEFPQAEIHATDSSPAALEIARANAARHQLESRIHFHQTDLLEGLDTNFDLIVSNPPYVGESEEDTVQLEVRRFEPRNAVFAGPKGTEIIARLIPRAQGKLKPGGWLIMEISGTIAEDVKMLLEGWEEVSLRPDLQQIPRVAQARKP